ncbi:MAG: hypothetical protein LC792_03000 [Actinobacteria bacterium]|nr:hypothetical protein [Actinomycetota bacterium]
MEHEMLVRTAMVEFASGLAALCLVVAAVICWRAGDASRRVLAVLSIAGCLAAGMVAVHSHRTLAAERASLCHPGVHRSLCDGPW